MSKNTRSKANSLSASNASENNDLNELDGGLEAVMQTKHTATFLIECFCNTKDVCVASARFAGNDEFPNTIIQ